MSKGEKQKHTLNLRQGDFAYLDSVFSPKAIPTSLVIRKIISDYVDQLRQREQPIEPRKMENPL